jgi:mannosylglycerate hydrolase
MVAIRSAHILSHTHWDREWYLNSAYTNPWLVPFFDSLFKMLDKEPGYRFILDGQTSLIEDWLEQLESQGKSSADARQRLSAYVRAGRVSVGPYYLQPDWQLVSEEALVRNLLIGRQMAAELGGAMQAGWLLDNFGQISQAPQIHRQFGLEGLFVWRGVEMNPERIQSEFTWQSPDGSQVLAVYLVSSYRNAMRLAQYPQVMARRIQGEIEKLSPFASTPNILLMNGYDQEMQPDDILPALRGGLANLDGIQVVQSIPEEYLSAVQRGHPHLPVLRGALYSGRYISVFPGNLSSRIYLKIQNDTVQRQLEGSSEPLAALMWTQGLPYPAAGLTRTWKLLLKSHPHDSICGVSIDDVHTDMEKRFTACAALATEIEAHAYANLVANIDTTLFPNALCRWVIANPTITAGGSVVCLPSSLPEGARWVDNTGNPLSSQTDSNGALLLRIHQVPSAGYCTLYALPPETTAPKPQVPVLRVDPLRHKIENEFFSLEVAEDGRLNLTDRDSGKIYSGLAVFEDRGDAGDTYNYSFPAHDQVITNLGSTATIRFLETGPLRARVQIDLRLSLPKGLAPGRKRRSRVTRILPVSSFVTVEAGSPLVKIHTQVLNTVRDHRLRVLFPTGLDIQVSHAEVQFDVITRPITPPRYDDASIPTHVRRVILGAREPEPATLFPQRDFVDLNDGQCGFAIINRGLPEFEVLPENRTIALTLFRSVGWIARPDLFTRIGDAGPLISVPGAQCLRRMEFNYAIIAHAGDWQISSVPEQAESFNRRLLGGEIGSHPGSLPPSASFFRLLDPSSALKVTAIKRAEDGMAIIIRLHNLSGSPAAAKLQCLPRIKSAVSAGLTEDRREALLVEDPHSLALAVGPKKILTLRLELEPPETRLDETPQPIAPIKLQDIFPDGLAGIELSAFSFAGLIRNEKRRADRLEVELAEKAAWLADVVKEDERRLDPVQLHERYRLKLEVATLRRTALEARLSETLLRKNAEQGRTSGRKSGSGTGQKYESVLRQLGDAINSARVEKRALEYVVDEYARQAALFVQMGKPGANDQK